MPMEGKSSSGSMTHIATGMESAQSGIISGCDLAMTIIIGMSGDPGR